jgi:DNA-binding transcriptional LysR family regulator
VVAGWAHRVLAEVAGLMDGAEALRTRRDAELRIAASLTVAEYLAPAWIGELRRQHPALYVGLQVMNSEHVAEQVHNGAVEIGFVESPGPPRGLSSRRVASDHLVVVVAPAHRWARRRNPLTARELSSTPLLVRERGSGTRDTLDHALARAGTGPVRPLLELGSSAAVRGAVVAGTGPAVLSELAIRADLDLGRLVAVPVSGIDLRRTLRAVWQAGHALAGPAAELVAIARRAGEAR